MGFQDSDLLKLCKSLIIGLLTLLVVSQALSQYIIQPLTYDGTLVRTGRYSFTFDAWDTIGNDEQKTVVGIGTSITQYALSGNCIEEEINSYQSNVYNLGVPGSLPYIEMMQTTVAIQNNPSLILLEMNPINMYPLVYASDEYIEMRIKLNSLYIHSSDYGKWTELLRPQDAIHLDGVIANRYGSESTYFNEAAEDYLQRFMDRKENDGSWLQNQEHWYLSTPTPQSSRWEGYLGDPVWLPRYLDSLNITELEIYENETIPQQLQRPRYQPILEERNLNQIAIEYMVKEFSENDIPVILISYPIHPSAVSALNENQFEAHNQTLENLNSYHGVTVVNLIWENYWTSLDFYDIEHLDESGRERICAIITPKIDEVLNMAA